MSCAYLSAIVSEAVRTGVNMDALFQGLAMDVSDFETPGLMLSHGEAIQLVRHAKRLMNASGLDIGMHAKVTERGVLALGLLAADTLGDAIDLSMRFPKNAGYLLQVWELPCEHGRDFVAMSFQEEQDIQSFLVAMTFAARVQLCRQVSAQHFVPLLVECTQTAPKDAKAYEAYFGCPVHFGGLRNAMTTAESWRTVRLPWADPMAYRLSIQLLQRPSGPLDSCSTLGLTVERAILRRLPRVLTLAQVAVSLNTSERSLRRSLHRQQLGFRGLVDQCRKSRALDLMTERKRTIAEISRLTGFSNASAFTRAFTRWTGHSPSQVINGMAAALGS